MSVKRDKEINIRTFARMSIAIMAAGMLLVGCQLNGKNSNNMVSETLKNVTNDAINGISNGTMGDENRQESKNIAESENVTQNAPQDATFAGEKTGLQSVLGKWNRTQVPSSYSGTVTITNADESGFDFEMSCIYYSHSGDLTEHAVFVSEGKAVCAVQEYYGNEQPIIEFEFKKEGLTINTTQGINSLPFGMNVIPDGDYVLGEPSYTNENVLQETFSEEELAIIKKTINDDEVYEEYFVFPVEYGVITSEPCTVAGGIPAKLISVFVPTMGGYDFVLLITETGDLYIDFGSPEIPYKTNTTSIEFPEYAIF